MANSERMANWQSGSAGSIGVSRRAVRAPIFPLLLLQTTCYSLLAKNRDTRRSRFDVADDAGGGIAGGVDGGADVGGAVRPAGDEQAARRLRVGQHVPAPSRQAVGQVDAVAVARPVAIRGAGDETLPGPAPRPGASSGRLSSCSTSRAPEPRAISSAWPSRPKPVTSVIAWTAVVLGQLRADAVEQRRGGDHLVIAPRATARAFLNAAE